MNLYYHNIPYLNFGDDLNLWLWPKLIGDCLDSDTGSIFVGIGTLLNTDIPAGPEKFVFGSGAGYGKSPAIDGRWRFYCVRGPLSAEALGLSADLAIADPAILIRRVLTDRPQPTEGRTGFVPHHGTALAAQQAGIDLRSVCGEAGVHFIDPRATVDEVVGAIRECEVVSAESMHGAILADAMRIPWVPVRLLSHILEFKWLDWCQSVDLDYKPLVAGEFSSPVLRRFFREVASDHRPVLSEDSVIERATERLSHALEEFRRDALALRGDDPRATCASGSQDFVWQENNWSKRVDLARSALAELVPRGKKVVLVDNNEVSYALESPDYELVAFVEREGVYWGPPLNDRDAIAELERLRKAGATHLAVAWTAFWWWDIFPEFATSLRTDFAQVLDRDWMVVFDLRQRLDE